MLWCPRALAKLTFQLFCVWRSQGRRKGDPKTKVLGKILNREFVNYRCVGKMRLSLNKFSVEIVLKSFMGGVQ